MKKISAIILLLFATFYCSASYSFAHSTTKTDVPEQGKLKRYDVSSAIIHYTTTTSGKVLGSTHYRQRN